MNNIYFSILGLIGSFPIFSVILGAFIGFLAYISVTVTLSQKLKKAGPNYMHFDHFWYLLGEFLAEKCPKMHIGPLKHFVFVFVFVFVCVIVIAR